MAKPMPAVFFGHGNPMNALADNGWTRGWAAVGAAVPRPRAVLCVSAHWYLPGTMVTAAQRPRTIHDFGGFPRELYEVQYPAPGDPALADRVRSLLAPIETGRDERWGLDHGAWSVLVHVFPAADVPVVQMSIDETRSPAFHHAVGRKLAPLRDEGILVIGSGNLVHNLHAYAWGQREVAPFDWALRFESRVRAFLLSGEDDRLIEYEKISRDALLAVPTPDHYLPLLYIAALRRKDEAVVFPVEGFDGGSISMLAARIG